jgi:hypothetical protein
MKLYYWPEFGCDYTCGIAFAIAETEQQAKELIIQQYYLEMNIPDDGDDSDALMLFQSEVKVLPVEIGIGRYCLGGG